MPLYRISELFRYVVIDAVTVGLT